jgi:cytidylate kinase
VIDSTAMTIDQVVEAVMAEVAQQRLAQEN